MNESELMLGPLTDFQRVGSTVICIFREFGGKEQERRCIIKGETARSWLIQYYPGDILYKCPKSTDTTGNRWMKIDGQRKVAVFLTNGEWSAYVTTRDTKRMHWAWVSEHRGAIERALGRCDNPYTLTSIAALLGVSVPSISVTTDDNA